jgi:predicted TPR repeat methyltransferase
MSDDKISSNEAIDAALHLDGDPQRVKEFYEDWAKNYNVDTTGSGYIGPAISAKLLTEFLPDRSAKLLDAGCGTGLVGVELHAAGYDCIDGFDLSDSMAEQAAATGTYQQVQGSVDMMRATGNYPDAAYDALLSVGVFTLGHVPPEALNSLLRLIRSGGLLLVSTRTHYYDQTNFQQLVDDLIASGQVELLKSLRDAPYNVDGDGHYWVFKKSDHAASIDFPRAILQAL